MELLFVTVIGAGIGLIVRYVLPSRGTYGVLLVPAISAAATAITWVALLWAGLVTPASTPLLRSSSHARRDARFSKCQCSVSPTPSLARIR